MHRQVGRDINRARGGLSPTAAVLTIAGVLSVAGLVARRYSPDPTHPKIQRWYKSLEKPPYKPPDPLFGAIWPVLETLHSYGAYRLMQAPRSSERDAALALWLTDIAFVSGWARIFFGGRSLAGALGVPRLSERCQRMAASRKTAASGCSSPRLT